MAGAETILLGGWPAALAEADVELKIPPEGSVWKRVSTGAQGPKFEGALAGCACASAARCGLGLAAGPCQALPGETKHPTLGSVPGRQAESGPRLQSPVPRTW